jgi:hypothetical protein
MAHLIKKFIEIQKYEVYLFLVVDLYKEIIYKRYKMCHAGFFPHENHVGEA